MSGDSSVNLAAFGSAEPLPLSSLLANFSASSQDALFGLLEGLEVSKMDESARRMKLFLALLERQRQTGQVFALVKWVNENHKPMERLSDLQVVLDRRVRLLERTCESLAILQRRVEDQLYPLWDVFTAVHVMSSGTYRLLPGIIETRLIEDHHRAIYEAGLPATESNPLKPPVSQQLVQDTTNRLNQAVHIKLLSTPLPPDLSDIRIRNGIAYLTFGQEFEIGVSLRMRAKNTEEEEAAAGKVDNEQDRISWSLLHLKVLMNVDQQASLTTDSHASTAAPPALFQDVQILHLIRMMNHASWGRTDAIDVFYTTMHNLLTGVLMGILNQQAQSLSKLFAMQDMQIEYSASNRVLNIKYWRDMPEMPVEGNMSAPSSTPALPNAAATANVGANAADKKKQEHLSSPCLQILLDETDRLSIRHNPPLPFCEGFPNLLSLQLSAISVPHLLSNVLRHHGNQRVEALFAWIVRETRDKRKIVGAWEVEVKQRWEKCETTPLQGHHSAQPSPGTAPQLSHHGESRMASPITPSQLHTQTHSGQTPQNQLHSPHPHPNTPGHHTQPSSSPANTPPPTFVVVPRSYLIVRLIPGYTISIHCDTQTGRFVMEWEYVENAPSAGSQQSFSNLNAFYGSQSLLSRVLHSENCKLNAHLSSIFEILLHLKMSVLCVQLAALTTSIDPSLRIVTMHTPFLLHPPNTPRHFAFDQSTYKLFSFLSGAGNNEALKRPGFGPYTVVIQLNVLYAPYTHILLQLNPYAQLTPLCYLLETSYENPPPTLTGGSAAAAKAALHPLSPGYPLVKRFVALDWHLPPTPPALQPDPSAGFSHALHREAVKRLFVPASHLHCELTAKCKFQLQSSQVITNSSDALPANLPAALSKIVSDKCAGSASFPHFVVGSMPFPLNYSMYNPAWNSLELNSDTAHSSPSTPAKPCAHFLLFTAPPRVLPSSVAGSDGEVSISPHAGFIVYFSHPLIAKLMHALQDTDAVIAKSLSWQRLNSSNLPPASFGDDGVVALTYESYATASLMRFFYDLDNLYTHICWVSNYLSQLERSKSGMSSFNAGSSNLLSNGGNNSAFPDMGSNPSLDQMGNSSANPLTDEFVENEINFTRSAPNSSSSPVNQVLHSAYTKATSLNPHYFPHDFYRIVEFSANQIVFAYLNPDRSGDAGTNATDGIDGSESSNSLCYVIIQRDHTRTAWKRADVMQPALYNSSTGAPPVDKAFHRSPQMDYKISLKPNPWPQLSFYNLDFNTSRTKNLLALLHTVWVAHRSMKYLWNFLAEVQRWQYVAGITSSHIFQRQSAIFSSTSIVNANNPPFPLVHFIAESATRLRLVYGTFDPNMQAIFSGASQHLFRLKCDLRLVYEGELLQDWKTGHVNKSTAHQQGGGPVQSFQPGKVPGDFTSFLQSWYRTLALGECGSVLKQINPGGAPLMGGVSFGPSSESSDMNPNLHLPLLTLTFVSPNQAMQGTNNAISPYQFDLMEQQVLQTYFGSRFALPPYVTEPIAMLKKLLIPSPTRGGNSFKCFRQLLGAWAYELLQPLQFPSIFPQQVDSNLLRQGIYSQKILSSLSTSVSSPVQPLAFRFVLLHRAPFETHINAEHQSILFTLEVIEPKWLVEYYQLSQTGDKSGMNSLLNRIYSIYLPLAYNVESGLLHRWEIDRTSTEFVKVLTTSSAPLLSESYTSLAEAIHEVTLCSMDALVEWASAPAMGPSQRLSTAPQQQQQIQQMQQHQQQQAQQQNQMMQ